MPGAPRQAATATNPWPAARRHVQVIDGQAWRFTSRLARVVELNFTLGFGHQPGKRIISQALTRIAGAYGFDVTRLASPSDGSTSGMVPAFTLEDLLAGEVLVANMADGVPTRRVKIEPFRFRRDITRDPAYADRVTMLLKFDGRTSSEREYIRPGGNLLSYLYRVGTGMTSYLQFGHENDEILDPGTGFDGGVGDFDRYLAQLLFFLAGYEREPCAKAGCDGLPEAGPDFLLTGGVYGGPSAVQDPGRPGSANAYEGPYEARVLDVRGRLVLAKIPYIL